MKIYRVASVVVVSFLAFPFAASAQSATCAQAYEKAQEERADGRLNAALAELRLCVESACPEFVREDCKRWLNETEAELPTVVFSVVRDGKDVAESDVFCDGELLIGVLDGKAVPIDPGFHVFTARILGAEPVENKVLIRAGERNRIVDFDFHVSAPPSTPSAPPLSESLPIAATETTSRSRLYWTYGLSGIGVLGLAGFTLFGTWGRSEKSDLEHSCAPYCDASQVDSVRTKYHIADTCLGVGLVSLGVATYLYISSRGKDRGIQEGSTASVELVPRLTGAGGVLRLSRSF